MPINRRVPLAVLADALRHYLSVTKQRVTIQYVLLAGVNDSEAHADELAKFLATVSPPERLHINLIPYNPQSGVPRYAAPSEAACKEFKAALSARNLFTKLRFTRGDEQMAACGQLGNLKLRRELQCVEIMVSHTYLGEVDS
jgi:23S rRNA (adenine2503-C2)-methyltransferase